MPYVIYKVQRHNAPFVIRKELLRRVGRGAALLRVSGPRFPGGSQPHALRASRHGINGLQVRQTVKAAYWSLYAPEAFADRVAQFLMLDSETVQVGLLKSRLMVYELTEQGEPARHWWSSSKVVCIKGDLDSARISIADADDNFAATRWWVWTIVFKLSLAIAIFLCWQLWFSHGWSAS
jgi:hypothetical protein